MHKRCFCCSQVLPAFGDVERLRAESASLRRALQDAELEIQHMSDAHQKQVQELLAVTHCSQNPPV